MLDWMLPFDYESSVLPPDALGQALLSALNCLKRIAIERVCVPSFTEEEQARLTHLRERIKAQGSLTVWAEFDLDPRRLEFTRWLMQHGKVSEGVWPA
jgi:hypothetical protein